MLWYHVQLRIHLLLLSIFFLLAFSTAFGIGLWLSALNAKYRDVRHIVPYIVSLGMFVSPVGFMSNIVPVKWRFLYSLNPMVGVIDGFRWCILAPISSLTGPAFGQCCCGIDTPNIRSIFFPIYGKNFC